MDEKKFTVLMTDSQEVKMLECDPHEEIFEMARGAIGCDWIEVLQPDVLADDGYLLLIDEEGKLKDGPKSINCIASDLYGSDQHLDPVVGSAVVVKADEDSLTLLTKDEAENLSTYLAMNRRNSIEKIANAFGLRPTPQLGADMTDSTQRQSCKKPTMER